MSDLQVVRLPLFAEPSNRGEVTTKDAKLVNGYIETHGEEFWVYKRPGLVVDTTVTAATGYGVFQWNGDVYAIWGSSLYKNGVAVTGTVDTANGVYTFDSTLGATPRLFFHNGKNGYTYESVGGLTHITDVNFPSGGVKGSAYLDGTLYVPGLTNVQGSDLNNPLSYPALNTVSPQIEPDQLMFVAKQLVYVVVFKQWSTEIFYDAANSIGSPIGTVPNEKLNYGCASGGTVASIDGVLFWAAVSKAGGTQIAMLENLKLRIISTPAVERLLQNATLSGNTVYSWTARVDGQSFYGVTSAPSNITLVYAIRSGLWSQWTDSSGNYFPLVASSYKSTHQSLLQHVSNGKLYKLSGTNYTDDGTQIVFDLYTPSWDAGMRSRKYLKRVDFIDDVTVGSVLSVRKSDDNFNTWSGFRKVDMGKKRPYLDINSRFTQRAYHIRHTANTPLRLQAIELQIEPCAA